jgi:hypothetical protein
MNPPESESPSPRTSVTSTRSSTLSIPSGQGRSPRKKVETKKNVFPSAKDLVRNIVSEVGSGNDVGTKRPALNPPEPTSSSLKTSVTSTRSSTLSALSGHGRNRGEPSTNSDGTISSVFSRSRHRRAPIPSPVHELDLDLERRIAVKAPLACKYPTFHTKCMRRGLSATGKDSRTPTSMYK